MVRVKAIFYLGWILTIRVSSPPSYKTLLLSKIFKIRRKTKLFDLII